MPLLSWLCGNSSPTTASSPTSGSAASTATATVYYQALTNQTSGSTAAVNQSTGTAWHDLTNQTVATSTTGSTVYWVNQDSIVTDSNVLWEEWVQQSQYVALARRRVALKLNEQQIREMERQREELQRVQRQMAEEQARRYEQQRAEHEAAFARSRELLLSHLTKEQRDSFEALQWFVVQGGKTKTRYRIRTTGYTGNIEILQGDRATHRLCGHLRGHLPLHDHHIAQKISLEWDEETFVRICNRSAA